MSGAPDLADAIAAVVRAPLRGHRFSYQASRASECADEQGKFFPYHDRLFAQQDSIGLKSFEAFAKESGVADLPKFAACANQIAKMPAVDSDILAAEGLRATGTPTIIVNGMKFVEAPDASTLDSIVKATVRSAAMR